MAAMVSIAAWGAASNAAMGLHLVSVPFATAGADGNGRSFRILGVNRGLWTVSP